MTTPGTASDRLHHRWEEFTNCATHGLGLLLSIAALISLLAAALRHGGTAAVVSCAVFGGSLVALYAASTLYHGFPQGRMKDFFHVVDHSAIYVLIAGTYTPFMTLGLRGTYGWTILAVVWTMALLGIGFKLFTDPNRFKSLSVGFYLVMGWMVVVAIKPLLASVPMGALAWLLAGGMAYTFGVVFYVWRKIPFHHAIWHFFVMVGSACHFLSIYLHVVPKA